MIVGGKITNARFGFGGYDDAMVAVLFSIDLDNGCSTMVEYTGSWASEDSIDNDRNLLWSGRMALTICNLLREFECKTIDQMIGKRCLVPFEFERNLGIIVAPKAGKPAPGPTTEVQSVENL